MPSILSITPSLHSALKRIRHPTRSTYVWADAACINQSDLVERSNQVLYMDRIYREAAHVVIFLGEESDHSEFVPFLVPVADRTTLPKRSKYLDITADASEYSNPTFEQFTSAWRAFLRRPWFMRLWVIQEAALATTAIAACGSWAMTLGNLVSLANRLIGQRQFEDDALTRLQTFNGGRQLMMMGRINELVRSGHPIDMLWLLSRTRRSLSTNPVDYLWGVQGLDTPESRSVLSPDYELGIEEVLKRFAKYFIDEGFGMDMLCYAHVESWRHGVPSWVPGWATHDNSVYSRFWEVSSASRPHYFGSVGRAEITLGNDNNIISVKGRRFGTIDKFGESQRPLLDRINDNPDDLFDNPLRYWIETIDDMLAHVTNQDQTALAVMKWSTLTLGAPEYELFTHKTKTLSNAERNNLFTKPIRKSKALDHTYGPWYVGDFLRVAIRTGQSLRLGRSSQVGVCQVPYGTEIGDNLVLFRGSRVPFVLRRVDDGEWYRVVGPCFVHGYMGSSKISMLDDPFVETFNLT
jgi:hypothetical protein